jgi:F-type H+-transporting ATPase subunit delta
MNTSIIAGRYAKALFLAGRENRLLDEFKDNASFLYATIKENSDFERLLDDPVIRPDDKRKIMSRLLSQRVHPMVLNFIDILIKNKREALLGDITLRFTRMYEEHKGVKNAQIISAVEMDEAAKRQMQEQLNTLFQADVRITASVNPDIIGGFILRIDDWQYDASISSGLRRMKKELAG